MTQSQPTNEISLNEGFEMVFLTREQTSAILQKLGELFTDTAPDVRQSFIDASRAILDVSPDEENPA